MGKLTCCGMADFNFPCLWLSLLNLQLASIILLPPCGSVWQLNNTISLIIGIIWSSFAFDCKTIYAQMYWWLTCDLSHQLTSSSLLLSGSLDPRGLGQGLVVFVLSFCQTCMIHCHLTRENKAEKWGISGPRGLFLQNSGLHYNIQRGYMTHIWRYLLLWTLFQTILVSNLQRESLQAGYKTFRHVFTLCHIFSDYIQFYLYFKKGEGCWVLIRLTLLHPQEFLRWMLKKKYLSHIQWSKAAYVFALFTFHLPSWKKYDVKE